MSTTPIAADAPGDLDRLYGYAAWMLGDRAAALAAVRSALASAGPGPSLTRLPALRTTILAHAARRRQSPPACVPASTTRCAWAPACR